MLSQVIELTCVGLTILAQVYIVASEDSEVSETNGRFRANEVRENEMEKTQPRPATSEELVALRKQNERFKAERLKKLQAQWKYEDESGETEAAIERRRFRKHDDEE